MQKLKKLPLLSQIGSTLRNLLAPVNPLLGRLRLLLRPPLMAALICVCLILFLALSACAPQTVRPTLPAQADARSIPDFEGKTYRDVLQYVIELREGWQASEADKAAIRSVYGD